MSKYNDIKSQNAKIRCLKWCKRHHLDLVRWNGSYKPSHFVCTKCGQNRIASFTNLIRDDSNGVCFKCRIRRSIKKFYGSNASILKIDLDNGLAKLKCNHCGNIFRIKVSKTAKSTKYNKCKCLNINNQRIKAKENNIKIFCKKFNIKLIQDFGKKCEWELPCGHHIIRRWDNLKQGHIHCPECETASIVETRLRVWLNKNTKFKWFTERPLWLKNPKTNKSLEIDIYCEKLKVGIEYNGSIHYMYSSGWNTEEYLKHKKYLDKIKKKLCKENGIYLLVIDGTKFKTFKASKKFMLEKLPKKCFK